MASASVKCGRSVCVKHAARLAEDRRRLVAAWSWSIGAGRLPGLLEQRDVRQDEEPAAVGRDDDVVEPRFDGDPAHRRRRQSVLEARPRRAVVQRVVERAAGAGEEHPFLVRDCPTNDST